MIRPRRLRTSAAMRRLVRETRVHPAQLVLPVFVVEDLEQPRPISSMPGVFQQTLHTLPAVVEDAAQAGIGGIMLFGVPVHKDALGSGATDPQGILARAVSTAQPAELERLKSSLPKKGGLAQEQKATKKEASARAIRQSADSLCQCH